MAGINVLASDNPLRDTISEPLLEYPSDRVSIDQQESLVEYCRKALSEKGRLSTELQGFVPRDAQIALSMAIVEAVETKSLCVAEAGTGTGKTFAYLIPCLMSKKKVLISTATKTLQDQLFNKDLPQLLQALGLSVKAHNLKGRGNYLCLHRIMMHNQEGRFTEPQIAKEIAHIASKLPKIKTGDRGELPEIAENSPVWPYATSQIDNCLGAECSFYNQCFLVKARRRALESQVVIINHHLFFADSQLKEEGFGELLPGTEVVVFDEAHQLAEIATHFHGSHVSTRQLQDLVQNVLNQSPVLEITASPLLGFIETLKHSIEKLLIEAEAMEERFSWSIIEKKPAWKEPWSVLIQSFNKINEHLPPDEGDEAELKKLKQQLLSIEDILSRFTQPLNKEIVWVERFKRSLIFHLTPLDIAPAFNQLLSKQKAAYIFTSATLTVGADFSCFLHSLGLQHARTLQLASPFNYAKQALLYLPRDLPDPKHPTYYTALLRQVLPVIDALQGRCFFLFTSHKALKEVAQLLGNTLKYPLLIQGEEAKPILLKRFKQLGNAVLLGTATFWEGVDVKGEALAGVIIDKLPFASPYDPVVQGKLAHFQTQGISGFAHYSLPGAILALKQGVGRLIRDYEDYGVLVIADPRLTARGYGRDIFASLPPLVKTREEQKVLAFIKQFSKEKNEIISD